MKGAFKRFGDSLLSKTEEFLGGKEYQGELLSLEEIHSRLSKHSVIQSPEFCPMVDSYFNNSIQPYEEDYSSYLEIPQKDIFLCGIFDGHFGDTCSHYLNENLLSELSFNIGLNGLDNIDQSIYETFCEVDRELCFFDKLSGSTCLVSIIKGDELFIGNSGNCRAILLNKDLEIKTLTNDHSVGTDGYKIRNKLADVDPHAIVDGKIKGLIEYTRCFGDAAFKIGGERLIPERDDWFPPYITSEPEITKLTIHPEEHLFMVMGSEGLWKNITEEELCYVIKKSFEKEEDPTVNVLSCILEKKANRGQEFDERLSSVLLTPKGFQKMLFQDITLSIITFPHLKTHVEEFKKKLEEEGEED